MAYPFKNNPTQKKLTQSKLKKPTQIKINPPHPNQINPKIILQMNAFFLHEEPLNDGQFHSKSISSPEERSKPSTLGL